MEKLFGSLPTTEPVVDDYSWLALTAQVAIQREGMKGVLIDGMWYPRAHYSILHSCPACHEVIYQDHDVKIGNYVLDSLALHDLKRHQEEFERDVMIVEDDIITPGTQSFTLTSDSFLKTSIDNLNEYFNVNGILEGRNLIVSRTDYGINITTGQRVYSISGDNLLIYGGDGMDPQDALERFFEDVINPIVDDSLSKARIDEDEDVVDEEISDQFFEDFLFEYFDSDRERIKVRRWLLEGGDLGYEEALQVKYNLENYLGIASDSRILNSEEVNEQVDRLLQKLKRKVEKEEAEQEKMEADALVEEISEQVEEMEI